MPRQRPPGAGARPVLRGTTALLAILLVLPWITTAAQQQQPATRRTPQRDSASYVEALREPHDGGLHAHHRTEKHQNEHNDDFYTPLFSKDERAVATKDSSAPARLAVRAPRARNAAHSGGLTAQRVRSLRDWEVEDFVLLATVDGRIHARDRYNGNHIWTLDITEPMVKTVYNTSASDTGKPPFLWVVEPKEDGALYLLTPGPHPVLSGLGKTVRELAEQVPFVSEEPPVVFLADKKNVMLVIDARTGEVLRTFSTSGSNILDPASCVAHRGNGVFHDGRRECKGTFNIGRTEYTISIQNQLTGEHMCTITYSEWTPNTRDRDLHAQYMKTMDSQYIYSRYDGHAIAMDHRRPKPAKRPVFEQKLSSPVVRVFDVARPNDSDEPETPLVLLPQPPGPSFLEDKANRVWLNTTEEGSWYALSETNYPAVTDQAPSALCYNPEWYNAELLNVDHHLPDRQSLVGVHLLDHHGDSARPTMLGIEAPSSVIPIPEIPGSPTPEPENISERAPKQIEGRAQSGGWLGMFALVFTVAAVSGSFTYLLGKKDVKKDVIDPVTSKLFTTFAEPAMAKIGVPSEQKTEVPPLQDDKAPANVPPPIVADAVLPHKAPDAETEKKVVRFEIPEDEDGMAPLSRTTTADLLTNGENGGSASPETVNGEDVPTPKKKKAHRGRRGGAKKKKDPATADDVSGAVHAAMEIGRRPSLHPDEVTVDGDITDVSSIKKIGKLTIDCDRVLGNGSGGTFVFEGKWHVSGTLYLFNYFFV